MLNRFEYTPDHEKDWQKQDRETGPLSGFNQMAKNKNCVRTLTYPECPTPPDNASNPATREYHVAGYNFIRAYGAHKAEKRHDGGYILRFTSKGDIHMQCENGVNRYENGGPNSWIYPNPSWCK